MAQDTDPQESIADVLAARGIVITPEGRQRARRLLDEAAARRDPEARAALLARLRESPAA